MGEFEQPLKLRVVEVRRFLKAHPVLLVVVPTPDASVLPIRYRKWCFDLSTIDPESKPFALGNAAYCYRGIQRGTGRLVVVKMMKKMSSGLDVHSFG
jgi:hypothetical protein